MDVLMVSQNYQSGLSLDGVWIAIPAFNEARTIREQAKGALAQCRRVIIVDDGSSDDTAGQLQGLPVTLLTHDFNRGKAQSLRTAFEYALNQNAQCVISMDGDGQHDAADASRLLRAWRHYPDYIVIGSRLHDRAQFPPSRYYANRVARFWISWAAGYPIADSQSGFRVYPSQVMQFAVSGGVRSSGFTFESEVLIEAGRMGWSTMAIAIPGCYPARTRPSHFRPVVDICKIVLMVAGRLLRQGMAPRGLLRSLKPARILTEKDVAAMPGKSPEPGYEIQNSIKP